MNNLGRGPEAGPGQTKAKAQWLRSKLNAAVNHLRDIEDYNRIWDGPPGTYQGSFEEAQADRARNIHEQITADFYEGKLGQPTMKEQRGAAIARAEKAEKLVEAFHDWVGDYRGPLPADLRLLIRGNDRGHSESVNKALKVADDFEAWIEEGKELLAVEEL